MGLFQCSSLPVVDFHQMVLVLENEQEDSEVDEDRLGMRKLEDSWKPGVLVDLEGDLLPKKKPGCNTVKLSRVLRRM